MDMLGKLIVLEHTAQKRVLHYYGDNLDHSATV